MGLWDKITNSNVERIDDVDGRGDELGLTVWAEPPSGTVPNVDIIFIHGLTGKRESTWRKKGEVDPWPKTMLAQEFPEARIMAFGYDADIARLGAAASLNNISDHARTLLSRLQGKRHKLQHPIFFVGHSLGGLLIKKALILAHEDVEDYNRDIARSTRAVMFFGTPHSGAEWASLANGLVKLVDMSLVKQVNKNMVTILKRDSEELANIQRSFISWNENRRRGKVPGAPELIFHCYTEAQPIYVRGFQKRIVEPDSASNPGGYTTLDTINADHIQMTKLNNSKDDFDAVCTQFRNWMDKIEESTPAHVGPTPTQQAAQLDSRPIPGIELDVHKQTPLPSPSIPAQSAFYQLDHSAQYYRQHKVRHYWDHITMPAYEIYEQVYDSMRKSSDNFVYLPDFQAIFTGPEPTRSSIKIIWSRFGASPYHRLSKSYILAALFILHMGPQAPAKTFSRKSYTPAIMESLGRLALWVDCGCCVGGCGRRWNFANSIYGLRRGDKVGQGKCLASEWYDSDREEPPEGVDGLWKRNKDAWYALPVEEPRHIERA